MSGSITGQRWLPRWVSRLVVLAAVLLLASPALAMGRIQWKSRTIKESNEAWTVEVSVFLNSPPHTSLVPMRFKFTPVSYFERALIDGKTEPQRRVVPLMNKQPMVESVDVGFMDSSTGKVEPRTRFSFRVTRAHGYEAGEYEVEVRDARSDQLIGSKQRITFEGDNPVIDRRAMVFSDEKKPKKKEPEPEVETRSATEYSPDDPAYWEGGPSEPEPKEEDRPPPASMREGGCGCRTVGSAAGSQPLTLLGLSVLALGLLYRRRA